MPSYSSFYVLLDLFFHIFFAFFSLSSYLIYRLTAYRIKTTRDKRREKKAARKEAYESLERETKERLDREKLPNSNGEARRSSESLTIVERERENEKGVRGGKLEPEKRGGGSLI